MALLTFRKVRHEHAIDEDTIRLTLYRDGTGRVCGWFIGPARFTPDRVDMPFLPKSERVLASLAVVRAMTASRETGCPVWVVDPHDLWEPAWAGC